MRPVLVKSRVADCTTATETYNKQNHNVEFVYLNPWRESFVMQIILAQNRGEVRVTGNELTPKNFHGTLIEINARCKCACDG
jgi:hypothetical protein